MSCAEAILFTSQSQLRTSEQSTGEREINVLHGAHSTPARHQISGVIYTASSKTRPEAGSWDLLVVQGHTLSLAVTLLCNQNGLSPLEPSLLGGKPPAATRMVSPGTRPQRPQHLLMPAAPFVPLPLLQRRPPPSRVLWTGGL